MINNQKINRMWNGFNLLCSKKEIGFIAHTSIKY